MGLLRCCKSAILPHWNKELIGEPQRDDFHLLNFEKNKPGPVIINGKKEVVKKGSMERIYIEQAYVLEYAGSWGLSRIKAARAGKKNGSF